MPDLYDLEDLKMTLDVISNLHEVVLTEMQRRHILISHVVAESGITTSYIKHFVLDKKPLAFASDLYNLIDWVIASYDRPVWRS